MRTHLHVLAAASSLAALAAAQSTGCNSACMNYLAALSNERNLNEAVWSYTGPVTAGQISTVCQLAAPEACCDCGGVGLSAGNEMTVLEAWAVTCNTFNSVQDGGASAVQCWTSHFNQGCVDYDNLLSGASCGAGSSSSSSSGSGSGSGTGTGGGSSGGSGNGSNTAATTAAESTTLGAASTAASSGATGTPASGSSQSSGAAGTEGGYLAALVAAVYGVLYL